MPAQVIKTSGARQHNLENLRAEICFVSFDASEAMSFEYHGNQLFVGRPAARSKRVEKKTLNKQHKI